MKSPTESLPPSPRTTISLTPSPPMSGAASLPSAAAAVIAGMRLGLSPHELELAAAELAQGTIFGRHAAIGKMICRETEFALAETILEYRQRGRG